MEMSDEKRKRRLDRRSFLRSSGVVVGMAAMAPLDALNATADPSAFGPRDDSAESTASGGVSMSRQLAQRAAGLRYEDLPPAVVDRLKGFSLHAITSALLGSQLPAGKEAVKLMLEEEAGAPNGATILVNGAKVTKSGAAFANSEMIYSAGKLDSFRLLRHPGTTIVPCALAAAEAQGASGKEFIAALAAGYEVIERMAADFDPTVMARGFHASPVFGIFGGAVAPAKSLRFSENQTTATIGLCVDLAGSNLESGALREGAAARNAMLAVLLAKQGHPGGEAALEGDAGFYHAYAGNNKGELTYSFTGARHADREDYRQSRQGLDPARDALSHLFYCGLQHRAHPHDGKPL